MNTLRGVFPEPRPQYKRNFIQENMRQIKRIQGVHNKVEKNIQSKQFEKVMKYLPQNNKKLTNSNLVKSQSNTTKRIKRQLIRASESVENAPVRVQKDPKSAVSDIPHSENRYRHISVQTDLSTLTDKSKLNGVKAHQEQQKSPTAMSSGDYCTPHTKQQNDNIQKMNELKIDDRTKSNKVLKKRDGKVDTFKGYQRGIVPKYLRDRQREAAEHQASITSDPDCPPGHVTIPDAERKETLRALRQSYADLVAELNLLPVKTDTLRTRNRKIELERQLNKIEEGIKVFSRPKVYVKINS